MRSVFCCVSEVLRRFEGVNGDEFMRRIEPIAAYVPYMTCPGRCLRNTLHSRLVLWRVCLSSRLYETFVSAGKLPLPKARF